MKIQKYIVTIEMPDGDMISSGWLKDLIQDDCNIEDEGRSKVFVEEISTSEDLKEAAEKYSFPFRGGRDIWKSDITNAFKAGAKWQKGQPDAHLSFKGTCADGEFIDTEHGILHFDGGHPFVDGDKVKFLMVKEMTKAEEYACRYAGFSSPPTRRDCLENREQKDVYYAVLDGYERAEEDFALTPHDIELIVNIDKDLDNEEALTGQIRDNLEHYEEVLQRFNETRKK